MPTYDQLKIELVKISEILAKFPEQVKLQVYELLLKRYLGEEKPSTMREKHKKPESLENQEENTGEKKDSKPRKRTRKESYTLDRNLNLRGDKSIPSFRDFHDEKKPNSAKEFNAVSVYYLVKILGMNEITLDQAYTCYSEVDRKPPKAFRQSFIDTKNKEGWIEFNDSGNLDIPHRGIVFVEHDLPKPEKKKKT